MCHLDFHYIDMISFFGCILEIRYERNIRKQKTLKTLAKFHVHQFSLLLASLENVLRPLFFDISTADELSY